MKLYYILVAIIIVCASGAAVAYKFTDLFEDDDEITIIDFDPDRAYADEVYLCAEGPRMSGSENELRGAQYVVDQFQAAGLENAHLENYSVTMFEVNNANVRFRAENLNNGVEDRNLRHDNDFVVLGYSGSTNGNDIFDVVFVGNGTEESYAGKDVTGRAALVYSDGSLTYSELYLQALNHSAGASIIYENREYPIFKTSVETDENGEIIPFADAHQNLIPHFMMSKKVGEEIRHWKENESFISDFTEIHINFDIPISEKQIYVSVGDIVGSDDPDALVILGAHHDTCYNTVGAVDNTVGVSIIIETARNLAKHNPKKTIRLMTYGGEEEGIFGSTFYVKEHIDELDGHLVMMINTDMSNINLTHGNNLPTEVVASKDKIEDMEKIAKEFFNKEPGLAEIYNATFYHREKAAGSDHRPFSLEGFEVTSSWGAGCTGYHTWGDSLEYTNSESWQIFGRIMGSYALYLANE